MCCTPTAGDGGEACQCGRLGMRRGGLVGREKVGNARLRRRGSSVLSCRCRRPRDPFRVRPHPARAIFVYAACTACIPPDLPKRQRWPDYSMCGQVQGGNSCRRGRAEGGGGFGSDTRVEAGCNTSYYSGVRVRLPSLSSCIQPFIPRTKKCLGITHRSSAESHRPHTAKHEEEGVQKGAVHPYRGLVGLDSVA